MPIYRVPMQRTEYQTFNRYVEADDPQEAVEKAETNDDTVYADDGHEVQNAHETYGIQSMNAVDEISE